jgi:PKD repeat protein
VLLAAGCDKLPLLAPSGTVITLFAGSSILPVNGEIEIIATLIEQGQATPPDTNGGTTTTGTAGAGTPVHNGTLVSFTTTLGRIDPQEARTHNGKVSVRLISTGQSGTAKVIAYSGGARSGELEIKVGTAAAGRVVVTAEPQTLPSGGGTAEIRARVEDEGGAPLAGVPVAFTTTAGTLTSPNALTDSSGTARTALMTTREAQVTASAGAQSSDVTVRLNVRVSVSISPPSGTVAVGVPATFPLSVTAPTGANVTSLVVDFGDGTQRPIGSGSTSVTHVYDAHGVYEVTATATDATGERSSSTTQVVVAPTSVSISAFVSGRTATLTAIPSPSTLAVERYDWDFGDGTTRTTPGTTTSKVYSAPGTYTVTVTMVPVSGPSRTSQTQVVIP